MVKQECVLAILVRNRAGVLARIANTFSRRAYNIASLTVGAMQDQRFSRITVVLDDEDINTSLVVRQLYKQNDVLAVQVISDTDSVARELVLLKLKIKPEDRRDLTALVDIFRGSIVDISPSTATVQLTGQSSKIAAFLEMTETYELLEQVRSGTIAVARAEEVLEYKEGEASAMPVLPEGVLDEENL